MKQCPNCRRMVSDSSLSCSYCGQTFEIEEVYTDEEIAEINKKHLYVLVGILVVVLIIFIGVKLNDSSKSNSGILSGITSQRCLSLVKKGSLLMYPDAEIGKAFDNFFTDGEWKYFVSKDNKKVVEYNGGCTRNSRNVTLTVQFTVDLDSKTFSLTYMGVGNDGFTDYEMWDAMDTIMDKYYKTGS